MSRIVFALSLVAVCCGNAPPATPKLRPITAGEIWYVPSTGVGKTESDLVIAESLNQESDREEMRKMLVDGQVVFLEGAKIKILKVLPSGRFEADIESCENGQTGRWFFSASSRAELQVE
jgi:hypothetical protein